MCLYTKQTEPEIAEQDIECYKVYVKSYGDRWFSPYQECPMPIMNGLVTTELQRPGDFYIEKGFHSFACLKDAEVEAEWFGNVHGHEVCIAKCIIPKGSKYYWGKFRDDYSYCSESIKIEKIKCFTNKLKLK